jgi:hypothetical protein
LLNLASPKNSALTTDDSFESVSRSAIDGAYVSRRITSSRETCCVPPMSILRCEKPSSFVSPSYTRDVNNGKDVLVDADLGMSRFSGLQREISIAKDIRLTWGAVRVLSYPPRTIKKRLREAIGRAAYEQRRHIREQDLRDMETQRPKRSIGFVAG